MHRASVRQQVLDLVADGLNDCEVSRRTGVPRSTVREMRIAATQPGGARSLSRASACPRCWQPSRRIDPRASDYAELLGLYLGDGHINKTARTYRLRLFLDSSYPVVLDQAQSVIDRVFPENRVGRQLMYGGSMTILDVHSRHLPCLFPQHGAGLKHTREILLESWQSAIAARHPWPLIRGLIRSDGCSFLNRTGPYRYLSFYFSNRSDGVAQVFDDACEAAGLAPRCNRNVRRGLWEFRINRRADVAALRQHVGVKA